MNNSTLLPLLAVTASAAFGLGWVVRPAGDSGSDDDSAGKRVSVNSGTRSPAASRREGVDQGGPEKDFVARYMKDGSISAEDMKAAMKALSEVNDPLLRQKMLAALIENLTADNAKDAFVALRENRGGRGFGRGGDAELRLLANAWGRVDGPGAVAALREMAEAAGEDGRGRGGRGGEGELFGEIVGALAGWATVDGAAATAYLDTIEGDREKGMAGYGVIQGLLVNGVDEAMSFVQNMSTEGGRAQEMYMGMIAGEMLEQGEDVAKSWVNSLTDQNLKSGALTRLTMELMQDDRDAAAEWLVTYGDDDAAASAVDRLADSWSREDPKAVLEWADQLSGATKAAAYEEAMQSWAREDPTAAGEYLGTLAASPERDAAAGAYAERVSREDPVTAMDWAQTIQDDSIRNETVTEVAQDWYRIDQAAAKEWIAGSGLSEAAVKEITSPERGGGDRRGGPGGGRGR
ncbi:MAG: hypothetical protein QNK83_01025 [Akkermansiaceae bacterium]